jgi:hypothetical protein
VLQVFFDCDNLATITQDELNKSIRASCMLVVFLDDVTFKSRWCCDEVKTAASAGIPIQCVVNIDEYRTRSLVDQWYADASSVAELVFVSQIVEYSTAYRAEAAEKLAELVKTSTHAALELERTAISEAPGARKAKVCPVQSRRRSVLEQAAVSHILEQTGKAKGGLHALWRSSDGLFLWRFCLAMWLIVALNWTSLTNRLNRATHGYALPGI